MNNKSRVLMMAVVVGLIVVIASLFIITGCTNGGGSGGGEGNPTYTVTYDGNGNTGGSVPVDSNSFQEGQTVTVLGNTGNLTKTSYTFGGWNTAADGSGTDYAGGTTFSMGAADITLYAKWGGPGYKETYTADGVSFKMSFVPGGYTFPTGTDDSGSATVTDAYWIGETEVTYELWYQVYTWATSNGYNFANTGIPGNDGTAGNETASQEPVTTINWRDAMVFCNALTEYYNAQNGTTMECVYYSDDTYTTPIRTVDDNASVDTTPGHEDNPYVKPDADGFRFLTSDEWELAARWRDDSTNTVSGYTDPYFTKGNSASGATTSYNDTADTNPDNGVVDGKDANDLVAVYGSYWDGSGWVATGVSSTAIVKSKAADTLGLYDMSGNVYEWCFVELSGSYRAVRGGAWTLNGGLQVGYVRSFYLWDEINYVGLRFARTP